MNVLPDPLPAVSPDEAWDAFASGHYAQAAEAWLDLLATARDSETLCRYQLGYSCVLIAMHQYHEAAALLEELYDITQDSVYLHQLGYAATAEGKLESARRYFLAEQACLPHNAFLALATNAYELSAIAYEQGKLTVAFHYAIRSLEYAQRADHQIAVGYAYCLLGDIRKALKDNEKAQDCYSAGRTALSKAPVRLPWRELDMRISCLLQHPLAS